MGDIRASIWNCATFSEKFHENEEKFIPVGPVALNDNDMYFMNLLYFSVVMCEQ